MKEQDKTNEYDYINSVSQALVEKVPSSTKVILYLITLLVIFFFVWAYEGKIDLALAISVSLVIVIIVAGLIGTFVPLFLNKRGIDPAIATGPFITTSNDIFGIFIYFMIAKMILPI